MPSASTPSAPKAIGYVGLGLMGAPMVRRLHARGHALGVFDIVAAKTAAAAIDGVRPAASPAEAAMGADIVALNLPTTEAVEAAVFGPEGLATRMKPPQLLVDFSTIEVEACRDFARRLKAATGCAWVDAPVSGGPVASGDGTLAIMAGGEAGDIDRLRPLFANLAQTFNHLGPTGSGLAAKMVAQLIVGSLHVVLAEAAKLAQSSGIDAAMIPACVAGAHADGVLLRQLYPRMVARDFGLRAYARQLAKDMTMVRKLAEAAKLPTPMLNQALQQYQRLIDRGDGEADVAAIVTLYDPEGTSR
jgi:3-hydroxyisobutyrate dehydrogenase-like beta-hydroxyacid dehydrogenase